jgi:hypothetical protein
MVFERVIPFEKYVYEITDQGVDFGPVLESGEVSSAAGIKVVDAAANDVTSTLVPGGASLDGDIVTYRLADEGTPGMTYFIYALLTLGSGEVLGQCLRMSIPSPAA